MQTKPLFLAVTTAVVLAALTLHGAPAAGPAQFRSHDIDANFRGGYDLAVVDFNKDGKLDVIANALSGSGGLAWYENPAWTKHLIDTDKTRIVNQAVADIDGDGIPEVAFESSFAMQAAESEGLVWFAKQGADPKQPWTVTKIDAFPTSHHIAWADFDGDGKKELVNAPLVGPKSVAPAYDQDKASVFWYSPKDWKRRIVTAEVPGIIHRIRPVVWDSGKREQLLVASFEGITLYRATGSGDAMKFEKELLSAGHPGEKSPRLGASDVGFGKQDGKRFFASIEPWHGNEVVIYTEKSGKWDRRVLFDKVGSGHEIAVVDLNGDGRDDVVANDNQTRNGIGGVHLFFAPDDPATGEWKYQRLESEKAMNGCVGGDLNGDKRMDVVCTGAGGVIRWYENTGPAK